MVALCIKMNKIDICLWDFSTDGNNLFKELCLKLSAVCALDSGRFEG